MAKEIKRPCSLSEFVQYLDVSNMAVRRAMKKDRIAFAKRKDGAFEIDLTTQGKEFLKTSTVTRNLQQIYKRYDEEHGLEKENDENRLAVKSKTNLTIEGMTISDALKQSAVYKAKSDKLKYEKEAGSLIEVETVKNELESIGVKLQKSIMAVPDRISALLAAETDTFKINRMLSEELRRSLVAAADDIKRISP